MKRIKHKKVIKQKDTVEPKLLPIAPYKRLGRIQRISNWLQVNWRSMAFVTYFTICLFDFIIMPIIYQLFNSSIDPSTLVQLSQQFKDPNVQLEFLKLYGTKMVWVPITMAAGGTFHLAFGGILTAASYGRSQEKVAQINKGIGQSVIPDNPDVQ